MIRNKNPIEIIKIPSYEQIANENLKIKRTVRKYLDKLVETEEENRKLKELAYEIASTKDASVAYCPHCNNYQHAGRITCETCIMPLDYQTRNSDDVIELLNKVEY